MESNGIDNKKEDSNNEYSNKEDRIEDPDELLSLPTIELLTEWVIEVQEEVSKKSGGEYRGKWVFPSLAILQMQLRSHALEYPDRLEEFEAVETEISKEYGGDPVRKKYSMSFKEADKRLKNTLSLWHDIGAGTIDKRYDYRQGMEPDSIDFTGWSDE